MKSIQKPIRINPTKERDLYEFLETRGTKPALNFLFNFYQNNKNLAENIVEELKKMDFVKPTTTITKKIQSSTKDFNFDDDFTSKF